MLTPRLLLRRLIAALRPKDLLNLACLSLHCPTPGH